MNSLSGLISITSEGIQVEMNYLPWMRVIELFKCGSYIWMICSTVRMSQTFHKWASLDFGIQLPHEVCAEFVILCPVRLHLMISVQPNICICIDLILSLSLSLDLSLCLSVSLTLFCLAQSPVIYNEKEFTRDHESF